MRRTCTFRKSVHPPRSLARGNRRWTRRHVSRPADCRPKVAPHLDNISLGLWRAKFSRGLHQREGELKHSIVDASGSQEKCAAPNRIFLRFRASAGEP